MPRRARTNVDADETSAPIMSIFMKIDGIVGTVQNGPFEGYFPVSHCQWGSGKGISDGRWGRRRRNNNNDGQPAEAKRTCSDPSFSEMTISRPSDGLSAIFMASVGLNQAFDKISIEIVNADGFVTTQIVLGEVMISGFSVSMGSDSSEESISLNYATMELTTRSLLRTNLSVPHRIGDATAAETTSLPTALAVTDIAARILHFLETPELFNVGLTCKHLLRQSGSAKLKEYIQHTTGVDLSDTGKSSLNGHVFTADPQFVNQPEEDEEEN